MKVDIIYPRISRKKQVFLRLRYVCRWCFLASAAACCAVNLCVGAPWWSLVVIWSLWSVWNCVLTPDMIERNLISQTVKGLWHVCILLALINGLLAPGWAQFVIPIVGFAAMTATTVFFFMDMRAQRQNIMPLIWLVLAGLVCFACASLGWLDMNWPMIVLGSISAALALTGILAFPRQLWQELKKRFFPG